MHRVSTRCRGARARPVCGVTLYAQYTTAVSPVSTILLASIANSRFRLTKGHAVEAGFKASGWANRATLTGACIASSSPTS